VHIERTEESRTGIGEAEAKGYDFDVDVTVAGWNPFEVTVPTEVHRHDRLSRTSAP
jgi:hypothetical protein